MMGDIRKPVQDEGWTVGTLLEYWRDRHTDLQLQMEHRFQAQEKSIDAGLVAQRAAIDAALAAADKATTKAEVATELRFQSVNEFRAQLSDQAATFMTRNELTGMAQRNSDILSHLNNQVAAMISRDEALATIGRNSERLQDVSKRMDQFINRDAVLAQYNSVMLKVEAIAEKQTRSEGKGSGLQSGWIYLLGFVAALGTILSIYLGLR